MQIAPENLLRVTACPHPFQMANEVHNYAPTMSVAQILKEVQPDEFLCRKAHVWVNDEYISALDYETTFPEAGSHIDIRVVPSGAVGRVIGMIFLAIVMIVIAIVLPPMLGVGGALVGLGLGGVASLVTGLVVMAVGIVGNLILNALCPPATAKTGSVGGTADSPTFALQGASNVTNLYGPIPKTLGKYRVCPNNGARTYTEAHGDKQYLNLYFVWGWGPIQVEDLRIGQTPIESFPGIQIEHSNVIHIASGRVPNIAYPPSTSTAQFWSVINTLFGGTKQGGGPPIPIPVEVFPNDAIADYPTTKEQGLSIRLIFTNPNIRTTADDASEISIDIACPGGLSAYDTKGNALWMTITHSVHYKRDDEGEEAWIHAGDLVLGGATKSAVRNTLKWTTTGAAKYNVKVIRNSPDDTDSFHNSLSYWDVLRTIINEDPLLPLPEWNNPNSDPPGELTERRLAITIMRILATGQLSGTVSEFSGIVSGICPDWDKGSILTVSINAVGSGYTVGNLALVTQIGGSGGLIRIDSVDGNGGVTACSVWHGGYLYTTGTALVTTETSGVGSGFKLDILTVSDGEWIYRTTQNPASLYREVVQGQQCHKPLPNSRIDLDRLQYWHEYCSANKTYDAETDTEIPHPWQYNKNVDYQVATKDLLAEIASAGRASFAWVDSKLGVIIDEPQTFTKGPMFTPRNTLKNSFSGTIVYPDMPHAFRIPFRNENEEYLLSERLVLDDGYLIEGKDAWGNDKVVGEVFRVHNPGTEEEWTQLYAEASVFEQLELPGVTCPDLTFKHARYHIASARLRPETIQFGTDFEWLVATRGDRFKFGHDVMLVALAWGRVKDLVFEDIIGYQPGAIWNFKQSLLDSSGNAHTLTWQGGGSPSYTTGLLPGTTAVVLDGSHYMSVASHADFNPGIGDFTIECILKKAELISDYQVVLSTVDWETVVYKGFELQIRPHSDGSFIRFMIGTSFGVATWHYGDHGIDDTNWHYVAVSVDRDGLITFVVDNNVSTAVAEQPENCDSGLSLRIGRRNPPDPVFYSFKGDIDLVHFHKGVALTAQQMANNYASFLAGTDPPAEPIYSDKLSGVITDEFIPVQPGTEYVMRFRLQDNTSILCPLVNSWEPIKYGAGYQYGAGYVYDQDFSLTHKLVSFSALRTFGSGIRFGEDLYPSNEVTFVDPISLDDPYPVIGDLFLYGESEREAIDLIVKSIQPNSDLSATITAVSYNEAIYDSDQGLIPEYDPMMTLPVEWWLPVVDNIRSDGSALLRSADGSWMSRILISLYVPSLLSEQITGVEARFGLTEITGYYDEAKTLPIYGEGIDNPIVMPVVDVHSREVSLIPVEDGRQYSFQLRYVKQDGNTGTWTEIATHLVEGKTAPPEDVLGFRVSQMGSVVTMEWASVSDLDIAGYEIRYGAQGVTWANGTFVNGAFSGTTFTTTVIPSGTWDFLIKAIDTSGNYSLNAAVKTLLVYSFYEILSSIEQRPSWPGTLTDFVRNPLTGNLNPDTANIADANNFDLFDSYVDSPCDESVYLAPLIDLGAVYAASRMYEKTIITPGPDESVLPDYEFAIDYVAPYSEYVPWTIGSIADTQYVSAQITLDNTVSVRILKSFQPIVDRQEAI